MVAQSSWMARTGPIGVLLLAGIVVMVPPLPRALAAPPNSAAPPSDEEWRAARDQMVEEYVRGGGISHEGVLASMRQVPRHLFVDRKDQPRAYFDMAIAIGHGQTISPPYIVGFMTAQLDPLPTDKVLEVGTGSGYQAAVLSALVKDVYSIEIVEPLGKSARFRLEQIGYPNIHLKIGDGYQGWNEFAPFDKIIVTCSPEAVPQPLVEQLREGGLMVVPVGERFQQTLYRFRKREGKLEQEPLQATFFVPMTGQAEQERKVLPDLSHPTLTNASFELATETTHHPLGWYYVRQAQVVEDAQAPEGRHIVVFTNQTPGRPASALQSFGVDGERVAALEISCALQLDHVVRGSSRHEVGSLGVEFYTENRNAVGHVTLGPFTGTHDWKQVHKRVTVPKNAKLAVLGIGLFGATGKLGVDDIRLIAQQRDKTPVQTTQE